MIPGMDTQQTAKLEAAAADLPLPCRDEWLSFARLLPARLLPAMANLDIGLPDAGMSLALRSLGGAWRTIARSPDAALVAARTLSDQTVTCLGADGSIPYPQHSFDCVVVGSGMLAAVPDRLSFVRECNRVLKPSGLLLLSARVQRMFSVVPAMLRHCAAPGDPRAVSFAESTIYGLLKTGFDIAGSESHGKFFTQCALARALSLCAAGVAPAAAVERLSRVFRIARSLDRTQFWARGHEVVLAARRRQWRERNAPALHDSRSLGEAVLFNPPV